ncbi:hypothetical protein HKX48_008716, partial [Thoreauomyces humboldtii]
MVYKYKKQKRDPSYHMSEQDQQQELQKQQLQNLHAEHQKNSRYQLPSHIRASGGVGGGTAQPSPWKVGVGSQPSSASLDGRLSPLDDTVVEAEEPEFDDALDGPGPMRISTSRPGGAGGASSYTLDPAQLHRQLSDLTHYPPTQDMSTMYSPQANFNENPAWASVPSLMSGTGSGVPDSDGFSSQSQSNPNQPTLDLPNLSSMLSRSLSESGMSQSTSRRASVSVTTEMLGTLSMAGRDNVALLSSPVGRNSRRGSLIPPPAPLRMAGSPQDLQEHGSGAPQSNVTLTNSNSITFGSGKPKLDEGGWLFVPKGFVPVFFPAHVASNAEAMSSFQKLGAVFPTTSPTATSGDSARSQSYQTKMHHSPAISDISSPSILSTHAEPTAVYNLQKPRKPPRPANSFILYRRAKQDEVMKSNEGMANNEVSRLIGQMWANEQAEIKDLYKSKAEEAKRLHNLTFPDYKYAPRKPAKPKKSTEGGKKRSASVERSDQPHTTGGRSAGG